MTLKLMANILCGTLTEKFIALIPVVLKTEELFYVIKHFI